MEPSELYKAIQKLVGPIYPIGETKEDEERYQNLQTMTALAEMMLDEIGEVSFQNRDAHQHSRKRAQEYADAFMDRIGKELTEE